MDFIPDMSGVLIKVEENENSRFKFLVWFDYTKKAMNLIREGTMVAVPNFASMSNERHISILEVVSILPMHYGLNDDDKSFPGFVVEAAKSAVLDWEEQETDSTEDTTKIRCYAIPTNLEIVQTTQISQQIQPSNRPILQEESNIPMLGSTVSLLDTEFTEYVVNYGIKTEENIFVSGSLIRDPDVRVQMRIEDLLRTHFAIFGFTGAGKSNLTSTLINQVLIETHEKVKLVFFDLMSEYSALLIDQLVKLPYARLVVLGDETLPDSVLQYLNNQTVENRRLAAHDMVNTLLLPRALIPHRDNFQSCFETLLQNNKILIWRERADAPTINNFVEEKRVRIFRKDLGRSNQMITDLLSNIVQNYRDQFFTDENIEQILELITESQENAQNANSREALQFLFNSIDQEARIFSRMRPLPSTNRITIPEIIRSLNDRETSNLLIIQSHDPDLLRHFASMLGRFTYDNRKRSGQTLPLVSFIFDEADEYIPQNPQRTQVESSEIAMTIARRGRKFGLGIAIATQRVTYLNTSIMAQPHTYFVSKMPRSSDRERVSEAFGSSEDIFRQTFKFKKGDWMVLSYDATGLEAIPIPIHADDANIRIRDFLAVSNNEVP